MAGSGLYLFCLVFVLLVSFSLGSSVSFFRDDKSYELLADQVNLEILDPDRRLLATFYDDGHWEFDVDVGSFSDTDSTVWHDISAPLLTLTDSLTLSTGASQTVYAGNTIDRYGAPSDNAFYFNNFETPIGEVPSVYLANTTLQFELLTELYLPLDYSFGGTGVTDIESIANSLQFGLLAFEDLITDNHIVEVLTISQGGSGATELEGLRNNFDLGSLSVEDTADGYIFRDIMSVKKGGSSGSNSEELVPTP